jgi:hypothetical protein
VIQDITINTSEIQRITREYFEILYFNKLENLEEADTFLGSHDLPKLTKEDINHFNRSITKKTEAVIVSQQ